MKKITTIFVSVASMVPVFANAQLNGVRELLTSFGDLVRIAIPIIGGLALLYFFWGLAKFILKSGDTKAQEEGKNIMIWGIIALFVMMTVWGLVGFIQDNLEIYPRGDLQTIPGANVQSTSRTTTGGTSGTGGNGQAGGNNSQPFGAGDPGNPDCGTDSFGNPIPMC